MAASTGLQRLDRPTGDSSSNSCWASIAQPLGRSQRSVAVAASGFWAVAFFYLLISIGATLQAPLYVLYQDRWHFSAIVLTSIFATYPLGVLVALLLFGGLADQVGDRPVLYAAAAFAGVSVLFYLVADGTSELYLGRAAGGLAAGLAQGAATAALVELAPRERPRQAVIVATAATMGGFGVGALLAGLAAAYVRSPLLSTYIIYLPLLAVAAAGLARMPATGKQEASQSLFKREQISLPRAVRGTIVAGGLAAAAAFILLGLYASVVSSYLRSTLHDRSHAVAGALIFAVYVAAVAAQLLLGRFRTAQVRVAGLVVLFIGLAVLVAALDTHSLWAFGLATLVCGAGSGLTWMTGLATVSAVAGSERAGVFSAFYVVAYLGLAVPVVSVGVAMIWVSPLDVVVGASLLIIVLASSSAGYLWRSEHALADAFVRPNMGGAPERA